MGVGRGDTGRSGASSAGPHMVVSETGGGTFGESGRRLGFLTMTVDTFHPELSFNLWTYADTPVTTAIEIAERHGFRRVGLPAPAVVAAFDLVADQLQRLGLEAAYLMHPPPFTLDQPDRWPDERSRFEESIAAAAALGTPVVYTTTANAGRLSWEAAAEAAAEAFGPVRDSTAGLRRGGGPRDD